MHTERLGILFFILFYRIDNRIFRKYGIKIYGAKYQFSLTYTLDNLKNEQLDQCKKDTDFEWI